ncbi:hypothetical protein CR513_47283, partial [Mucuna pruriens]
MYASKHSANSRWGFVDFQHIRCDSFRDWDHPMLEMLSEVLVSYTPPTDAVCWYLVSGKYSIYSVADEEPVDQKRYLEESCKPKCVKPLLEYQACIKRIHGDETGQKHCTGQYFDYWSCIDKCVAPKLLSKLNFELMETETLDYD